MTTNVASLPNRKYCRDCGNAIFEQAEICPGCGCRQIGVASVETKEKAKLIFSTPTRLDIYAGAIFNLGAFFVLHCSAIASSHMIVFGGTPFGDFVKLLVLGTLIGTALWLGTGQVVSSIGAKEPKILLIARGLVQGILVVPIAAYLEPDYLGSQVNTVSMMLLALIGSGYAYGLLYLASRKR